MNRYSVVKGTGSYLPERVMTNQELAERVDTSHEWIVERTGIHQRHISREDEPTSILGARAAEGALEKAGIKAADLDLIILATTTPDHPFPSTAVKIQSIIGASKAFAFDVQAVCSGFVYALAVADNFIKTGQVKKALVIGAEKMSSLLDWNDRNTCVLFGDGAGALVLEADESPSENQRGIISTHLHSDGTLYDELMVNTSQKGPCGKGVIKMNGRLIFVQAVKKIGESIQTALAHNHLKVEDIHWFVPHQANKRIIDGVAQHFGLPPEKTVITVDKHANTSAASIPLALDVAVQDGRIQKGNLVLVEALGGGLTWGSALIRW